MTHDLSKPLRLVAIGMAAMLLLNACAFRKFAHTYYAKAQKEAPYDVVIVTGIPYDDSTRSGLIFTARVLWSKYLYDHHITNNIIYSGAAVSTRYYEGKVMKLMADTLGIPSSRTFSEIKAEHSTENVYYGLKMAHKLGFKKVAVAADGFQLKMLQKFIKNRCENIAMIPIIYDSVIPDKRQWRSLLPKINLKSAAADSTYIRLSERQSFSERWRGTQGKHIKYEE
jgi:hypothetical protein